MLDFFIKSANEANEPAQAPLMNVSLNSRLLYEQSDQWNGLYEKNEVNKSEHERILTS